MEEEGGAGVRRGRGGGLRWSRAVCQRWWGLCSISLGGDEVEVEGGARVREREPEGFAPPSSGFEVWTLGLWVEGGGWRVQCLGYRVWG